MRKSHTAACPQTVGGGTVRPACYCSLTRMWPKGCEEPAQWGIPRSLKSHRGPFCAARARATVWAEVPLQSQEAISLPEIAARHELLGFGRQWALGHEHRHLEPEGQSTHTPRIVQSSSGVQYPQREPAGPEARGCGGGFGFRSIFEFHFILKLFPSEHLGYTQAGGKMQIPVSEQKIWHTTIRTNEPAKEMMAAVPHWRGLRIWGGNRGSWGSGPHVTPLPGDRDAGI